MSMAENRRDALERMVETFNMTSNMPEDLDVESPAVKAMLDTLTESQRSGFLAMAQSLQTATPVLALPMLWFASQTIANLQNLHKMTPA